MAYDGFFAGLSTRASVNEILNLAIKTKNEAEQIAIDIKVSEENARLSAIEAALQADRAQRIADSIDGSGSGGGADLKSIGIYSGIDYGVVGGDSREESKNINKAIKACGEAGGGVVVIRSIVPTDPIFIDGPVQIEENNVTLYFESNVLFGVNGFIRVSGSFMEIRRPGQEQLIALDADSTTDEFGNLQFTVRAGDQNFLQVGDRLTLRGQNDSTGNAIEKQTVTVAKIEGQVITTYDDPEYTFRRVYPQSDWEPDWTTGTTVSIVNYSAFPLFSTGPNVISATVDDGTKFKAGDLLYVSDARLEKDIMSPEPATLKSAAVMEHVRVQKVVGNVVTFDKPLQRQYLNQWKGGLSQLNPVVNSHIVLKDLAWKTAQTSRKYPALAINFGDKCTVKVGTMRGKTGRIGTGVRVAYSYDCTVFDSQVLDAIRWDSAEAYGIVMYYSTFCRVKDCLSTGGRHNYLIQTCVSCDIINNISTDDFISGIDLHGAGAINCRIVGNRVTRSNGHTPDSSNGGAIRNGNTSHMIGDHGTLIANNFIEGYNDNAGAAAIDVSPSSQNVVVRDNHIIDSSIGFRHYKVAERAVVVQHANRVLLINNTFERVARLMDTQGHATSVIDELVLIGNKSINNSGQFQIIGVPKVTLIDNQIIAPVNTPGVYGFEVRESTDLFATGNMARDANRGFRIANCPNAKIIKNILDYTRDNVPFQDGGGNTGYIQKNNTLADSGGSGGATIQVGTVTTGEPGTDVIIVNSGTTTDAVFDFTIPRGDPGADGGGGGGGANSQALDGLVGVNGGLPMFTGVGAMTRIPSGTVGRSVLAAATVPEAKEQLGIANVDNTSDVLKPISNATQTALDTKAPLTSPIFIGVPTTPHPIAADDSRQIPTTNWVKARIAEIPVPTGGAKAFKTLALLGDSLSGNNSDEGRMYTRGFLTFAQQFSGHRLYFDHSFNFGVGGETASQIAARVGTVVAKKPDICLVEMGGNDTNQSAITAESVVASIKSTVETLVANGIRVILCTIYPTAGTTNPDHWKKLAFVNQWILDAAQRYNLVEVLDTYGIMFDNNTGLVRPNYTYDTTHPGAYGAWFLGKALGDLFIKMVPVERYQPFNNPNDKWDNATFKHGNIFQNPRYTGSAGTIQGSGGSGTIPDNMVLNMDSARGVTAAVAVVAGSDGFNTLEITLGGTCASGSTTYTNHGHITLGEVFGGTTAWNTTDLGRYLRDDAVYQNLQLEVELENLVGVGAVGVESFWLSTGGTPRPSNGDGLLTVNAPSGVAAGSIVYPTVASQKMILRAEPESNLGKSNGYRTGLHIACVPGQAVSGKIKIRRPVFRAFEAKFV